jgi:hypothetical protein
VGHGLSGVVVVVAKALLAQFSVTRSHTIQCRSRRLIDHSLSETETQGDMEARMSSRMKEMMRNR